jgi:hypothetical protein
MQEKNGSIERRIGILEQVKVKPKKSANPRACTLPNNSTSNEKRFPEVDSRPSFRHHSSQKKFDEPES